MAKQFVFFANTIKRVGGAQLYIKAKAKALTQEGWNIKVVYHQDGELFITEFQNYLCLLSPYMHKPSYMYIANKRNFIVKQIIDFLNCQNEEIVFESHSRTLASWAEVVADHIGHVKHLCYDLDENIFIPAPMFDFYKFKYERHELYGIQHESIKMLFEGCDYELVYGSPCLQAFGASECVSESPSSIDTSQFQGYVIGIVGRLEKDYVWESAKQAKQFIGNFSSYLFTIVFVGGAPEKENPRSRIEALFSECNNVKLVFTGYIFPIPRSLVTVFDICLASAGSASAIRREGVATVSIDPRDNLANGIVGITTQSSTFSEGDKQPIMWWLKEVYNNPKKFKLSRIEYIYDFVSHIKAINDCEEGYVYNTSFLYFKFTILDQIKKILNSFLPISMRETLAALMRRIYQ